MLERQRRKTAVLLLMGLKRGYEDPAFEGTLTILAEKRRISLSSTSCRWRCYIRKVIPSEMPSSYPLEALKAQAVCARTYAVKQMESPADGGRDSGRCGRQRFLSGL
ncbi:MAG: SpoIID/LytB domain-containing protein [Blautia sp.]